MGRRAILPGVALLLALSTMVVAQGHALMQRRTGAQVVAMTGDAEALEGTIPPRSAPSAGSRLQFHAG